MTTSLKNIIQRITPELYPEVENYLSALLENYSSHDKNKRLRLSWAGGLKEFKNQFTSLELQKKSNIS
jgi:hypothetical protein